MLCRVNKRIGFVVSYYDNNICASRYIFTRTDVNLYCVNFYTNLCELVSTPAVRCTFSDCEIATFSTNSKLRLKRLVKTITRVLYYYGWR